MVGGDIVSPDGCGIPATGVATGEAGVIGYGPDLGDVDIGGAPGGGDYSGEYLTLGDAAPLDKVVLLVSVSDPGDDPTVEEGPYTAPGDDVRAGDI